MKREWKPAGEVLGALEICDLPSGSIPLDGIFLIKALDEDGDSCWYTRSTKDVSGIENVGALSMALRLQQDAVNDAYRSIDEDEGDSDG